MFDDWVFWPAPFNVKPFADESETKPARPVLPMSTALNGAGSAGLTGMVSAKALLMRRSSTLRVICCACGWLTDQLMLPVAKTVAPLRRGTRSCRKSSRRSR